MPHLVNCHAWVTSGRAARSCRVGFVAALLPLVGLSAGDLDPQLKRVKQQWLTNRSELMSRLVAGQSFLPKTARMTEGGQDALVPATLSLTSTEALDRLGIAYTRITPSIVTAKVPLSALESLEVAASIKHVAMAHKLKPHNDINMAKMNVSVPHNAGYTGTDVLVGVIDTGLDTKHPAFRVGGVAGGASRVKYLWDQTATSVPFDVGTFSTSTGRRWSDSEITAGTCTETDTDGHGTHVAGSFAGYDAAYTALHGGAKVANILFVKTSFYSDDILNGIKWMLEQAKELGKPVVVNLSLGSSYGPHDGTDLDAKAVDDLVASSAGKLIVVRSGGNYAADAIHDSATVGTDVTALPVTVAAYTQDSSRYDRLRFNFYYDAASAISVRLKDSKGNVGAWMAPSASTYEGTMGDGSGYYLQVGNTAESYNTNLKRIFVLVGELDNETDGKYVRPGSWELQFKTDSSSTRLDGWLYDAAGGDIDAAFTSPDPDITLGNDACGTNVIAVAAYVSRYSWAASDGKTYHYPGQTQDAIATFSSIGPTRDGRQKPDVTGGGTNVLSTLSSDATAPKATMLPATGGQFYQFMQGTSMSSPTVAGAVALLKEAHPSWTYAEVLDYFKTNSQGTSLHTTQGTWDKYWGWGVMNLANSVSVPVSVSITPTGPVQVNPGATVDFKATVSNATSNIVNWTATGGVFSPLSTAGDGTTSTTYTAPATVGAYTVTATSAEDVARSASAVVNVYDPGSVIVAVTPATKTLLVGQSFTFTAAAQNAPSAGTFTWSVSTGGGTITAAGVYQAPATAGTYTVTATSSWGPLNTATVSVKTLDLNLDAAVDTLDVLQLTKRWGSTDAADLAKADLNGDGQIDNNDLTLMMNAL